jgi:hypothetical protein
MGKKKFSSELHDSVDGPAKDTIVNMLSHMIDRNHSVMSNPDRYGVDILIIDDVGSVIRGAEVEVKLGWSGGTFPFPSLRIPNRKLGLLMLDVPVDFYVLNREMTHCIEVGIDQILSSPVVLIDNRYAKDEMFREINITQDNVKDIEYERKRRWMEERNELRHVPQFPILGKPDEVRR